MEGDCGGQELGAHRVYLVDPSNSAAVLAVSQEKYVFQKQWLADTMIKDCHTCVHLFHKFPESLHDWRPSPQQRSVEELLGYLSICVISALKGFKEPGKGWRDVYLAKAKAMTFAQFPQAMEEQAAEIAEYFRDLPEEILANQEVKMPWGEVLPLGAAIVMAPAKWLPAYKMQLFLYAKTNGLAVATPNLWRGVDPAI